MNQSGRQENPVILYPLIFILVGSCIFGLPAGPGLNYSDSCREAISVLGLTGLLLYWFYSNRNNQKITIRLSGTRICLTALFLFASCSVFWAVNIHFFISKYLLWLATAVVIVLGLTLPATMRVYILLARSLILTATYIAVIGIIQTLFEIDIFAQVRPPAANFVNKNATAQVMVLLFPLSIFLLFFDKNKTLLKIYPFLISLILAYIFHTRTRSSWLAIGVEIMVIIAVIFWYRKELKQAVLNDAINNWRVNKISTIAAAFMLLLLINISSSGWQVFTGEIFKEAQDIYSKARLENITNRGSSRYHIWGSAVSMINQNPLVGTGMGSFYHNLIVHSKNHQTEGELRVHNDLLELGVELGIIGWLLLLAVVISLLVNLYQITRSSEIQQSLFYLFLIAALAGSAVNMQFSFPYQMPVPLVILGLYISLMIKGSDTVNINLRSIDLSLRYWHWYVVLAFHGVVFIALLIINFLWINSFAQASGNIKKMAWINLVISHPLTCHKTLVKSLHDSAVVYTKLGYDKSSIGAMNAFAECLPDTWRYKNMVGVNLINLRRYREAIDVMEQAKQQSPIGVYTDYINQFVAYMGAGDLQGARRVYRELSTQPEDLLAKRRVSLKKLVIIALKLHEFEEARYHYDRYRKYHGSNAKLEAIMAKH